MKEEEIKLKRQEQDDDGSSENWHLVEGGEHQIKINDMQKEGGAWGTRVAMQSQMATVAAGNFGNLAWELYLSFFFFHV